MEDRRKPVSNSLSGIVYLLGSSVLSVAGFMVIASRRWIPIDQDLATFIILFVQWQLFGLAISKIGIEHVVFAVVSRDADRYFAPRRFLVTRVLPLSALFSVGVGFVFGPWPAFVAGASIAMDVHSIIIMADMNARGRYGRTAVSNLLNYPLFFCMFFACHLAGVLDKPLALALFLVSSLIRWGWLNGTLDVPGDAVKFFSIPEISMGIQQTLNTLVFRIDQISLAIFGLQSVGTDTLLLYLFLAKFTEMIGSITMIVGVVIFPRIHIPSPFGSDILVRSFRKYWHVAIGYVVAFSGFLALYMRFWNGHADPYALFLPFLVQSLLILVVNDITYSMLRQGHLRRLIRNLAIASGAGVVILLLIRLRFDIGIFAWVVPVQLLLLCVMTFFLGWGEPEDLHA